ncbi:hypothetical protein SAY86_030579 [Trapa natans]|uniref:U-box domain-containing protein n=1 Tax=Trapa natans TaxID=22666 RepID=A0AAN7LY51_TRANT|nr:hypothetical protein SAY86_030579 [Trapa natans]
MPPYQPSRRERIGGGYEDGQVLDLDTAVKDGVLGSLTEGAVASPGCGGGCGDGGGPEKLDLRRMIVELDLSEIPSVFICPISLEPMQDPVTLCTGQTYERFNILKWFSLGRLTCPTTMQELWDESVTPNRTLHQLIYTWFHHKYLLMRKRSEDVQGRASELVETLKKVKGQARVHALKELRQLAAAHLTARKAVVCNGGVAVVTGLLGRFTSHAVGSESVAILVGLDLDSEARINLMEPAKVSLIVDMLNEGSMETRINCTRLIGTLIEEKDFRSEIISSHSMLVGLLRLVKDTRNSSGILPGLSLLKSICLHKQVLSLFVSIGAVSQLVDLLPSLDPDCLELALFILDTLSSLPEGKSALKDCPNTIPSMVRFLMRISESCTQYALSILRALCNLAPEECAARAVDAGLAQKLLLVIQSGCDSTLKQQSSELLKLCSLIFSDTNFISKFKLTRTIQ